MAPTYSVMYSYYIETTTHAYIIYIISVRNADLLFYITPVLTWIFFCAEQVPKLSKTGTANLQV